MTETSVTARIKGTKEQTWAANRNDRNESQSRSISCSSSARISGSETEDLAAAKCSDRFTSTVALNEGLSEGPDDDGEVIEKAPKGESERGDDLLRGRGLPAGENRLVPLGVTLPGVAETLFEDRDALRASDAA